MKLPARGAAKYRFNVFCGHPRGKMILVKYSSQILCEYEGFRLARKYVYGPGIDEPVRMTILPNTDLNGDSSTDLQDIYVMSASWMRHSGDPAYNHTADLNSDGVVDNLDADILAGNWRAVNAAGRHYYYHFDGLGSVIALTDSSGKTVEIYRYSAFGQTTIYNAQNHPIAASQVDNIYYFTGRQLDTETGLYYYRARMYSPALGRFMQTDPAGYADGMNWYAYCGNNPIIYVDPSGKWLETAWDVFNVVAGVTSCIANINQGNYGWAALDAAGVVYDVVATAVPFLPGGASAGFKAARAGNTVMDSFDVAKDVIRIANKTNDVAKVVDNTADATSYGRKLHKTVGNAMEDKLDNLGNYAKGANRSTGKQPDFPGDGIWADITTARPGEWQKHVKRYSNQFGEGIPILYERGRGVTSVDDMWRLRTGAGVGLGVSQWGSQCKQ